MKRADAYFIFLVAMLLILFLLLGGCVSSSINLIGTVPHTKLECYSIKDKDAIIAGILLLCTEDGQVRAATGGAAPGAFHPTASILSGVASGAGVAIGGALIGAGVKSLDSISVTGQLIPDTVKIKPPFPPIPDSSKIKIKEP